MSGPFNQLQEISMLNAGRSFEAAQDRAEYLAERQADAEERAAQSIERRLLGLSVQALLKTLDAYGHGDTADAIREEIADAAREMVPSWSGE
jgi:hypothetical protein